MSMIGSVRLVTDDEIEWLLADPERIAPFLYPEEDDDEPAAPSEDEPHVDKACHGIHFLLTGTAWEGEAPLNFVAAGGVPVAGDEEIGYGPARAFSSEEVQRIATALDALPPEALRERSIPAR